MNRRSFFKFLGIGAAAVAAPKILAEEQQRNVYTGNQISEMMRPVGKATVPAGRYIFCRAGEAIKSGDMLCAKKWGYFPTNATHAEALAVADIPRGKYGWIMLGTRRIDRVVSVKLNPSFPDASTRSISDSWSAEEIASIPHP